MVLYKAKKRSTFFKWILATAIFITALCITFSDVYGAI
jgi:hypothetical protein